MNNQGNLLNRQQDENTSVPTGAFYDVAIEDITREKIKLPISRVCGFLSQARKLEIG